jgi:hypothetical protein
MTIMMVMMGKKIEDEEGDSVVNNSENEEGDDGDRHCWDSCKIMP